VSCSTIEATLINDDGSIHRVLEISTAQTRILEPVRDDRRFGKSLDAMAPTFQVQEWVPLVIVELTSSHPAAAGKPVGLVGLFVRSRLG
jgi:hypothetical protein